MVKRCRLGRVAVCAVAILFAACGGALVCSAQEEGVLPGHVERVFATASDFAECFRDASIDVRGAPGFVTLVSEEVLIDVHGNKGARDGPGAARRVKFGRELLGKRVFILDAIDMGQAEVFFFGRAPKASVNGTPVQFEDFVHHGGWCRAVVGASILRVGENELVIHEGLSSFQDAETAPARKSFVSRDGGQSWEPAPDGELLVNIRLQRHPARGVITSPVVDLANADGKALICPLIEVRKVRVTELSSTPGGTSVALEVRCGETPWPDEGWSDWRRGAARRPARYVQWRATLATRDGREAPVLSRVTVQAETVVVADAERYGLLVTAFKNHAIVRGSHAYGYQRPSENLVRLRRQFDLDDVVAAGRTDWDRIILLRNWVRRLWPHNDAGSCERTWNAIEILSAPPGQHGMCVHYATAFVQCALALGYNARQLIIQNHFVADIWSDEHQAWAFMDVEAVYPPRRWEGYGTAHYIDARTRRPLNALELHRLHHAALDKQSANVEGMIQVYTFDDDSGEHVPHELVRETGWARVFTRFTYPLRNDFLDRLEPWEEYHGCDNYHSNDYLWWDSESPRGAEPQYPLKTSRPGDLYWTLNQAELTLTATERADVVHVSVNTVTPNFATFLYRMDGGEWQKRVGSGTSLDEERASIEWKVAEGRQRIEVKAVNAFGREGAVSSVFVTRAEGAGL